MLRFPAIAILVFCCISVAVEGGDQTTGKAPVRKPFGIEKRVAWTTSRIVGTPDPPDPYRTQVAFPRLKFESPLAMTTVPGTNRLAVAERYGKIYTFENKPDTAEKTLLLDLKKHIYGFAFHPDYLKNGRVFVTYIPGGVPEAVGTRVSRFTATNPKSFQAGVKSEQTILAWPHAGHTGGCLRFGPDGFLYVSVGDSSGFGDWLKTGQDLGDLPASILRIDVDRTEGKRPYAVPKDNPFVDKKEARPEIYSYGHRQVWKFSFDPKTGNLWAGDVGQDLWEMIYLVKKGGNYGWSVTEGSQPFRPDRPKGPTPIEKPIVEHNHNDFRSITGGYVYHGDRLPDLKGAYIYGDYDTGRIWSFRYKDGKATEHRELADTSLRVVSFGTDDSGEVYVVDFVSGTIRRLAPAPPPDDDEPEFPRKLSETGLFASTKDHVPAAGLIPYSVNAPLYSDDAEKERFLALPGNSKIEFDSVTYPDGGAPPGWRFPDGAVLVKTFSLELEPGNPRSRRRLETRILHYRKMPGVDNEYGAQLWYGYTYVWNDEQTDAVLLDAKGLDKTFTVRDKNAPGGERLQKWRFPSRAECTLCHTMSARYTLGTNTLQMNRDHNYGGVVSNQLATLNHLGVFAEQLEKSPAEYPSLADYRDKSQPVEKRARAYLHANCAHCHRVWGGGNADFQLLATLPLEKTRLLDDPAFHGKFDLHDPKLLVPGEPDRSMILHRMTLEKLGRMPHVASSVVDREGVELVRAWIKSLKKDVKQPDKKAAMRPLFNGKSLDGWKGQGRNDAGEWKVVGAAPLAERDDAKFAFQPGNGVLVNGDKGRTVNLLTTAEHGDCELHLEFCVPKGSNSGVYFQGRYEIQVLDSFGNKEPTYGDCGGVYRRIVDGKPLGGKAPDVNASKPPGEWQSFDVVFRAPRFDADGRKTENAKFVKVVHNGKVIHENVEVAGPTVAAVFQDEKPTGPIMLQGDHGPVAYRNLKIKR